MATHYKGKRINDLLEEINRLQQVIEDALDVEQNDAITTGYATLVIAKAKLTALQGEDDAT